MNTTEILTGIKNWVVGKLVLKQDVISDLATIRSGAAAGTTAVQPSDLSAYFNGAAYDGNSKRINFYHGQTVVAYIDATAFVIDGMVEDVRIENGYLIIDFNTASGKQDISIPLTDIFDPSNYYTSAQTDEAIEEALNDAKEEIDAKLDGKANNDGYYGEMTVGSAENLVGRGTVEADYNGVRTTAGTDDVGSGSATITKHKGNSVKFNQLIPTNKKSASKTFDKATSSYQQKLESLSINVQTGHKYYVSALVNRTISTNDGITIQFRDSNTTVFILYFSNGVDNGRKSYIYNVGSDTVVESLRYNNYDYKRGFSAGDSISVDNIMIIDLTQIFGEGNEPATVEEFEAWLAENVGKRDYYPYNAGAILNNGATGIKTRGFNLYDYATGKAYLCGKYSDYEWEYEICGTFESISYTDVNGNTYVPELHDGRFFNVENAGELTVVGGNNTDTLVHMVWSGWRNEGEPDYQFEPYWESLLQLNLKTITGKLNGTGESQVIFPYGLAKIGNVQDEIVGNVATKRIGVVDMGTIDSYVYVESSDFPYFRCNSSNQLGIQGFPVGAKNYINEKYMEIEPVATLKNLKNMSMSRQLLSTGGVRLYFRNESYSDVETFKTAMSGVLLYYELATPETYILDEELPTNYRVDDFGTEEAEPAYTDELNANIRYDVQYAMNAVDAIRRLPANLESKEDKGNKVTGLSSESTDVQYPSAKAVYDSVKAVSDTVARTGVYDVTANNSGATFASLSALLSDANLNTLIPTEVRRGGMEISFVLSSDNKYVQYRYMSSSTAVADFTNVANWQGIDDEPTAESDNLVKSGGVVSTAGIVFASGSAVINSSDRIVFDKRLNTPIPSGTKMFLKINSGIGTAATKITLAISLTGGWRNFDSDSYFVLPYDCTRLSISVQSGNIIGEGGLVDVSISYASSIPEIAYLGESIEAESAQREQDIEGVTASIGETEEALTVVESNVSLPFVVNVQSTSTWYKTPYTIKAGSYIVFKTNNQTMFGKTTDSTSENYESLVINTATTKDINYIRFSEIGDCTIVFSGIYSKLNTDADNIDDLYAALNIPKLFIGHITISSVWRPRDGYHYMFKVKSGDNVAVTKMAGISNAYYAILKSYNVQKKELVFATGCSLVNLSSMTTSKAVVPSDGEYLYVSYINAEENVKAGSVVINGYDVLNESIIGDLTQNNDSIVNLNASVNVEKIVPTLTYSSGVGKYISTLGVIKNNASYHYSDAITVKRNDVLIVDGRGGESYCCLALQAATGVFTPLVNYWDINHNYIVHFLYVVKEDCNIIISSTIGYDSITILRGADERTVELLSNIFTIPTGNVLVNESLLNPDECINNVSLDSSGGAPVLKNSSYWITNFIPVDESTNWLFVNYHQPTRVVRYDIDKQFESYVGSAAIPINVDMFNHPTVKYIRMVFAKSVVSYEERYKVRITKSTDGQSSSKANKQIDGNIVGLMNNAYVTNKDIAKFEADKIYGSYVSATVFNVDGEAVELDTTSVYIDKSTKRQYRYDGTGLYDVGYYDDKSLIFTESFSIDIPKTELSIKNLIVTASAKYYQGSGVTDKPMVQLSNYATHNLQAATIPYVIGGDRGFKQKEWRAQVLNYQQYKTIVNITIPTGVTLFIDKFGNYYSDKKGYETFPRVNAHAFAAPDNTIMYMEQNAKLGFACMITIPKRTYDGVWVCFHDDDKITRYARHEDGSVLTNADIPQNAPGTITSIGDCPIGYFTYEELMQFDFGIYNSYDSFKPNRGQKIPLLKDFFMICAKTGIHPMLSIHPNWTESEWLEIKAMTDKLSLTEKLNLKFAGGEDFFGTTYPVFGDEIESYAIDVSTSRDAAESMASLIETLGIDLSKVRVGIEYFRGVITTAKVNNAIANGMFAAMVMDGAITSEDYEYWMEHGVSEFTDDNHTSVGLNW